MRLWAENGKHGPPSRLIGEGAAAMVRLIFTGLLIAAVYFARHQMEVLFHLRVPEYQLFYVAIVPLSTFLGFWYGLAATLCSVYWIGVWIEHPVGQWRIENRASLFPLTLHVVLCAGSCLIAEYLRRKHMRLQIVEQEQRDFEQQNRIRTLLASLKSGVFICDVAGRVVDFNEAYLRYYRIADPALAPHSLADLQARYQAFHADGSRVQPGEWAIVRALRGEVVDSIEYSIVDKNTGERWVGLYNFGPVRDRRGTVTGAVITMIDITQQKCAEVSLRQSEALYRTVFQNSIDILVVSRLRDGLYIDVNPAFELIVGFSREEVIGKTARELSVWVNYEQDRMRLAERLEYVPYVREFNVQFRRKNGEVFWGAIGVATFEMSGERYMLSIARDISDARRAEEEIRKLAFFDPLTRLANRRLLMEQLERSFGLKQKVRRALMFVDLDNFKTLNDTLGHHAGDLLLQQVADRLMGCARPLDTVGRLGGDEFVLLIEDLHEEGKHAASQVRQIAERILASIAEPCSLDGQEFNISCSIGITLFGAEQTNMGELMQQADIAMYQSKAAGRNTFHFFAPALQFEVSERATLQAELREALRNNEFELFYQPQLRGARLEGAEALLRWRHPRRGLLTPGAFIAQAEESGLILPIGRWVLDEACRQMSEWNHQLLRPDLSLAVNLSALQLRAPGFVEEVIETITSHGARTDQLELELTESMLVENMDEVIARMNRLCAAGIRFAIDDFGTGYSSLTYLKRLPISRLKISQGFVSDLIVDPSSRTIAHTIISLGAAMHLDVIAEGVEELEQQRLLEKLGCNCYQGYLFSPPVPALEYARFVQKQHPGEIRHRQEQNLASGSL